MAFPACPITLCEEGHNRLSASALIQRAQDLKRAGASLRWGKSPDKY